MKRVALSWSSGKDSAWALHVLRQTTDVEVVALFTIFNGTANRVAMHAVRRALVEGQAERTGYPLWQVALPSPCSNEIYESMMAAIWARAIAEQCTHVAFGDLFLADVREYRERQLRPTGLTPLFPLWHIPTDELAREMIHAGVKATISAWTRRSSIDHTPDVNSTALYSIRFRRQWTRVAKTASFILLYTLPPFSRSPLLSAQARRLSATASSSRTFYPARLPAALLRLERETPTRDCAPLASM